MGADAQYFLNGGFQIEICLKAGVQYFMDAGFQITSVPKICLHEILNTGSQKLLKSETGVQKIKHSGSQTVIKSETGVHVITRYRFSLSLETGVLIETRRWFPLCSTFVNRRWVSMWKTVSKFTAKWKQACKKGRDRFPNES